MALATVLCASAVVSALSLPALPAPAAPWRVTAAAPGTVAPGTVAPDTAPVTLHHARECASVRRASAATIVVPVVVDLGGASDQPEVSCVSVPAGSNGAEVLAARAKLLGVPAPRYAISGLLCAIDGYPATGCGQQNGTHYAYWAYFHGGASWTYASVGPASWSIVAGDVEGWRFEPDGSATPADPPPRSASDAPTLCPASSPPTTTTTTPSGTTPSTAPATTVAPGPAAAGGHGGPGTTSPSAAPAGPTPFEAGTGAGGQATATGTDGPGRRTGGGAPTTTTAPSPSGAPAGATASEQRRGLPTRLASRHGATPGGVPVGLIVAVALIALLAVAAVLRARRRTTAG